MTTPTTRIDVSRNKALFAEVLGIRNPDWRSFLFLVLFISTLGWLGDTVFAGIQAAIGNRNFPGWSYMLAGISPFVLVSSWGWYRWKNARQRKLRLRATSKDVDPHAGVILFLSNILNPKHRASLETGDMSVLDAERFSWKPCHRGLEKHKSSLRYVWVACSSESAVQFPLFLQMFEPLFPGVEFEQIGSDQGTDFEDIGAWVELLEDVMHHLPVDIDESDVIIDITGGQKPCTAAGMLVSLMDEAREVQYVQTNKPHEVKTYAYHMTTLGRQIKEIK